MKVDRITFQEIKEPTYILEEQLLRRNLTLISDVAKRADVEIILAFFFIIVCFVSKDRK